MFARQAKINLTNITAAACNACASKELLLSTVPESSPSSHHGFQQKMCLLLNIWQQKSQKTDLGTGKGNAGGKE